MDDSYYYAHLIWGPSDPEFWCHYPDGKPIKPNLKTYNWVHKSGKVELNFPQNSMVSKYGLIASAVSAVAREKRKTHRGWRLMTVS